MNRLACLGTVVVVALMVGACKTADVEPAPSQVIETLLRREAEELWTQGRLGIIPELFADSTIDHYGGQASTSTHESLRNMVTTWRTAFPDLQMVIEDLVVSGDKAAARYTVSGTHLGELWGNQPTGKRFRIEQIYIVRVAAGRIVETWGVWDQYGFWRQLAFPFEP
jgi:predicted ester cyclase